MEEGDERIEEIADQLREFSNIGFGPITDLVPVLEYNGIIVIEEPVRCEDMLLNPEDVEPLCSMPPGTLQRN
jgi:hypothetical protein